MAAPDNRAQISNSPEPACQDWIFRMRGGLAMAAILALAATAHYDIARSFGVLARLVVARINTWAALEAALIRPDTGREKLLPAVTSAAGLIKAYGAGSFRLSPAVAADSYLSQRIAEVAWPSVIAPASPLVLRLRSEMTGCTPLSEGPEVALDRCD